MGAGEGRERDRESDGTTFPAAAENTSMARAHGSILAKTNLPTA
jgi:hypothetical protein